MKTFRSPIAFTAFVVIAVMCVPGDARAQYLYIGDVPAEAKDNHKEWINLLSVSQYATDGRTRTTLAPTSRGPGTIVITRRVDRATSELVQAAVKGTVFAKMTVRVPNTGATRREKHYIEYHLTNVQLSSTQARGRPEAIEMVSLNYSRIDW